MTGSLFSTPSSPFRFQNNTRVSPSSTPPSTHHQTFSESIMDESMEGIEAMIRKWDIDSKKHSDFSSLFDSDKDEAKRFLQAFADLQKAMHFYAKLSTNSDKLVRTQNLMQMAVKRLEKEFYTVLSANRKNLDAESVSGFSTRVPIRSSLSDSDEEEEETSDQSADAAMTELKSIADAMIGSGYGRESVEIYKIIRKSIIDETLYYLHVEKISAPMIQKMEWDVLDDKIKNWLRAVRIAVKTLFLGEKILCDFVFSSSEMVAQRCFTEISKDAAVGLFDFPQNFAKSKKILSPEKMFRGLDLYEAISELWPEIESIFGHESLSAVKTEAGAALVKLGESVRIMLNQFEAAIRKDSSNARANGGVHPLTRYVMNYLIFLGDYSGAIADILSGWTVTAQTPLPESYFLSPTSAADDPSSTAISTRLAWLILVLLCKLDGKAVQYSEPAQSYLFLANNLNYVVSKVRTSTLGILMGVDWLWKHGGKVKQYLANYERMGWNMVITSLSNDSNVDIPDKFRRFYVAFEEAYKKQKTWVISDSKVRDEVKISLSKKIVTVYRELYQKYRGNFPTGYGAESVVRYAPEDLDNYLSDMFFSAAGSGSSSTSGVTTRMTGSYVASPEPSTSSR